VLELQPAMGTGRRRSPDRGKADRGRRVVRASPGGTGARRSPVPQDRSGVLGRAARRRRRRARADDRSAARRQGAGRRGARMGRGADAGRREFEPWARCRWSRNRWARTGNVRAREKPRRPRASGVQR